MHHQPQDPQTGHILRSAEETNTNSEPPIQDAKHRLKMAAGLKILSSIQEHPPLNPGPNEINGASAPQEPPNPHPHNQQAQDNNMSIRPLPTLH